MHLNRIIVPRRSLVQGNNFIPLLGILLGKHLQHLPIKLFLVRAVFHSQLHVEPVPRQLFKKRTRIAVRPVLMLRRLFGRIRIRFMGIRILRNGTIPDTVFGKRLAQYPFKHGTFNRFRNKLRKAFVPEHFPRAADRICRQGNDRKILILPVLDFPDMAQRFHAVKAGHHMIQENNIIRICFTPFHCLPSAQAGIHLQPVAAQNPSCHHKVHFFIVHHKNPHSGT